jgi:hypothetical protein
MYIHSLCVYNIHSLCVYTHTHTHAHTQPHTQPPIVIGDFEDGAGYIEVEILLDLRRVRPLHLALYMYVCKYIHIYIYI